MGIMGPDALVIQVRWPCCQTIAIHRATEAFLDELEDAPVGGLARVVAHDEEGGALDAEARAEHQAGAVGVVLPGPHDLVDAVPQAAGLEVLGHLGALPAVRAVGELLLHHDHVHRTALIAPRPARRTGAGSGDVEVALRNVAEEHVVGRLARLGAEQTLEALADLATRHEDAVALQDLTDQLVVRLDRLRD